MTLDHICFAVKDLNEGIQFWQNVFGYFQFTEPVINTRQKVKVAFLKKEGSLTIKIIEPLEQNKSLLQFVNQGGGFHHICFKCEDINEGVKYLTDKGLHLLVPPQPGEAFGNNNIAFFLAAKHINIELIDTDFKTGIIEK